MPHKYSLKTSLRLYYHRVSQQYTEARRKDVYSLSDLLAFFNYTGPTAGVVKLKLYFPYPPILHILTTAVASVIPMEYALGDKYEAALRDSNYGKNPAAWANYVIEGEDDPSYKLLKINPYPLDHTM
jgi:peptide/nickel transport system substrate-binding protein